jgi:hypothetical protein
MSKKYRMTPKRKAALRKAQLASAKKRRQGSNRRLALAGGVTVVAATAGAVYLHRRYNKPRKMATAGILVAGQGHGTGSTAAQRRAMGGTSGIVPFGNPGHEISLERHRRKLKARNARNDKKRKRQQLKKTFRQRMAYSKKKHRVPKVNRFTRQEAARRRRKKK